MEDDLERILWTESDISARVSALAAEISESLKGSEVSVVLVGVATGSFTFLADIARRIPLPLSVDLVRVESYGSGTESSGEPRLSCDLKVDVRGKHVILVLYFVPDRRFLFIHLFTSSGGKLLTLMWFLIRDELQWFESEIFKKKFCILLYTYSA